MKEYDHNKIEKKWQKEWSDSGVYKTLDSKKAKTKKLKPFYVLDMFPYPSGAGLHVGHPRGYIGSDVYARVKRMQGFNVLHPMGYDAFGLPAEQYAIEHKIHPRKAVDINVKTFEKQLSIIGLSYDWSRRVNTTDPEYYRWTQWIFLQLFNSYYNTKKNKAESIDGLIKTFEKSGNGNVNAHHTCKIIFTAKEWKNFDALKKQEILMNYRLAYEAESEVNWCEGLGTVLANDEIMDSKDGKTISERGGFPVEKMTIRQWSMRITAYADRLIKGLETLDWSSHIKEIQKNWIGESHGLLFEAPVKDTDLKIQTFSAHFEACYADTFVVIASDHPFLRTLTEGVPNQKDILEKSAKITEKRNSENFEEKEVEGVFTGRYIIDPLGNGDLPIWVASFALANYGTGIVKCSAHDQRDFAFAKKYNISIKAILLPENKNLRDEVEKLNVCFFDSKTGVLNEPAEFRGKNAHESREAIADYVVKKGFAKKITTYKMRDAIFARQRYWGEPIPLKRDKNGIITAVKKLPLELPKVTSYEPTGKAEGPLAGVKAWVKDGYETNTMPGWAGSSWYFLRYMDPKNSKSLAGVGEINYWKNVDMYVGGAEHATGHLLYSRFWHKFLKDIGVAKTEEPFKKMKNQGMILASDNRKMSKRWGNVINPDEIVKTYGADTLRVYEMFMGPFDQSLPWSTESIIGSRRFIERVYRLSSKVSKNKTNPDLEKVLHKTIKKVNEDIENFAFNTAISSMMIFVNEAEKHDTVAVGDFKMFLQILAPFAPHFTDELWHEMGEKKSIHVSGWPKYNPKKIIEDVLKIVIQVNGKVRAELSVSVDATEDQIKENALKNQSIASWVEGKEIKRIIYVKGRLVNIVV